MKLRLISPVPIFLLALMLTGCKDAPGNPRLVADAKRPDQVLDFPALYRQNCAACHGQNGRQAASISLANPVYLAFAGEDMLRRVTATGVPGTLMPAFAKSNGGMLTDQQIAVLSQGIVQAWGNPLNLDGLQLPAYTTSTTGDAAHGQQSFTTFCARCHGADGAGITADKTRSSGSVVDPTYLALVSDQFLRSTIVAGRAEDHMPDWRTDQTDPNAHPMSDQEIADIVAWLAAHRVQYPGKL